MPLYEEGSSGVLLKKLNGNVVDQPHGSTVHLDMLGVFFEMGKLASHVTAAETQLLHNIDFGRRLNRKHASP